MLPDDLGRASGAIEAAVKKYSPAGALSTDEPR